MTTTPARASSLGQDSSEPRWRPFCYRCWRARILCLCNHVKVVDNPVEVLFLQHPNERKVPMNTARLAHLSLARSRLVHGVCFDDERAVRDLLPRRERVGLLFPSPQARELRDAPADLETLIVVDGTWREAKKMIWLSPVLDEFPHYAFVPEKPSNYRIRKEPKESFISSIEATVAALRILDRDPAKYGELLDLFDRMVDRQVDFLRLNNRPGRRANSREDTFHMGHLEDLLFTATPEERCATLAGFTDEQRLGLSNIARELYGIADVHAGTPLPRSASTGATEAR
jgi:DTW domain-containing protein YfiP